MNSHALEQGEEFRLDLAHGRLRLASGSHENIESSPCLEVPDGDVLYAVEDLVDFTI